MAQHSVARRGLCGSQYCRPIRRSTDGVNALEYVVITWETRGRGPCDGVEAKIFCMFVPTLPSLRKSSSGRDSTCTF